MPGKVLLIEDSPEYQFLVAKILNHVQLIKTDDPDQVMTLLEANPVDLILLDLSLPKRDGFSVLQELQSHTIFRHIPVICLTGKGQISDKVTAFSLGADDYIQKPFDNIEFKVRVDAKLMKVKRSDVKTLNLGDISVDLSSHRVHSISLDKEITLTQTEFKILVFLGRHPDMVYSREQLLSTVWGDEGAVFDRAVDVHICSIRKKLAPYGIQFKSVPGIGYKIIINQMKVKKVS